MYLRNLMTFLSVCAFYVSILMFNFHASSLSYVKLTTLSQFDIVAGRKSRCY
jgi:hypothetical protein